MSRTSRRVLLAGGAAAGLLLAAAAMAQPAPGAGWPPLRPAGGSQVEPAPRADAARGEAAVLSPRQQSIRRFYETSDSGLFADDLFTPDFEFYIPKFGVGSGPKEYLQMRGSTGVKSKHHIADLLFIESGRRVAVEGTTEGVGPAGVRWKSGQTPGGRFSAIFVFNDAGLIERMYLYVDPDITGADKDRFKWNRGAAQRW